MYFRFKPYLRSFNLAPETQRDSLTTIILDNRTTEINQFAFYDCFKLKEVNLSYCISLTSIGYMAFGWLEDWMSFSLFGLRHILFFIHLTICFLSDIISMQVFKNILFAEIIL